METILGICGVLVYLLIAIFSGIVLFDDNIGHDPDGCGMFICTLLWPASVPIILVVWLAKRVRAYLDRRNQ